MGIFGSPNVEKMKSRKDLQGLMKALKHINVNIRNSAAEALKEMGWQPNTDTEKAYYACYLSMARRWAEVVPLGRAAIVPISDAIKDCVDPEALLPPVNALAAIGHPDAIEPLLNCIPKGSSGSVTVMVLPEDGVDDNALAEEDEGQKKCGDVYSTVLPAVAGALTQIGAQDSEPIINHLQGSALTLVQGVPLLWALCEIGDRKATQHVVDWLFKVCPSTLGVKNDSPCVFIREYLPGETLKKLLGDYADPLLEIFAWEFWGLKASAGGHAPAFDLSRSVTAVERLCQIESAVSSNILLKVSQLERFAVAFVGYIECTEIRTRAAEELRRRENPCHNHAAYLVEEEMQISAPE